jgi:hypothetical protein
MLQMQESIVTVQLEGSSSSKSAHSKAVLNQSSLFAIQDQISQIIQTDFQNPSNLLKEPSTFSLEQCKSVLARVGSVSVSLMNYSLLCCFSW